MARALLPGLWLLEGTRGCNVYLLEMAGQLMLVDCGFGSAASRVIEEVAALFPERTPALLLLTHHHVDHAGAAAELSARLGLRIAAGVEDCTAVEGRHYLRPHLGRRGLWRARWLAPPSRAVPVDLPLAGEVEVVPGLLAVPAPGHTPGSYCYVWAERRVALAGDLVISHRDGLARPLRVANEDDAQYLASLAAFALRSIEAGCAGHGPPVMSGFDSALRGLAAQPRVGLLSPQGLARRLRRLGSFILEITGARSP